MDLGFRGKDPPWSTQKASQKVWGVENHDNWSFLALLRPPDPPILISELDHCVHKSIPTCHFRQKKWELRKNFDLTTLLVHFSAQWFLTNFLLSLKIVQNFAGPYLRPKLSFFGNLKTQKHLFLMNYMFTMLVCVILGFSWCFWGL